MKLDLSESTYYWRFLKIKWQEKLEMFPVLKEEEKFDAQLL